MNTTQSLLRFAALIVAVNHGLLLVCPLAIGRAEEDLRCLAAPPDAPDPTTVVYADLQQQAYAALARRQTAFEQLKTPEQIQTYQENLRKFFIEQLGGFPDRSPLNARTVGSLDGDGYRVEKVIFASQPQHHITALLFLPTGPAPHPAVAVSSGHSRTAKTADYNQRYGIALARNGIAALCYDPIGQGERSQILTIEGAPQFAGTTQEHFLIGVGSILLGTNTARYRTWDGMRAIDYLTSRSDIDPQRIGFTGCSGGGTVTSYVMALDDRVACAAPACYLTSFHRLVETIGPQDAEQNIFGQIAFGLDHPDYVLMRAPRPTLISSTTADFFDIQGTWDNFRQAKRIYTRLGFSERVDLVEADGAHGVQPENLVAITRWMRRWLLGNHDPIELAAITPHAEADLLCTDEGQVLRMPGEKSVFDLHRDEEQKLAAQRQRIWSEGTSDEHRSAIRELAGVRPLDEIPRPQLEKAGRVDRPTYHIDKLVLRTPSGLPLPTLTYHPPEPVADAYLYLHEDGKLADGAPGGPIEKLVEEGYVVVSVDLRGQGETASGRRDETLGDWKSYYLAYLLGQSLVGLQTEDALATARFVAYYETATPRRVHLVGIGNASTVALHAAALEPELFSSVTLGETPFSWASLIGNPVPRGALTQTIHGALQYYDIPDLVKLIAPSELKIQPTE